ncbi:inosine/xanthosine triphosphatase [Vibrio metschnikovii]|uniref:Probable inosine/xanthosine triphosphatase n=1 Tax=bacterium 19MO02SH05 TaxID=2920696 RepID=A0AAU6TJH3_UNCXX|nr:MULTISPECIES: inosine/xanthosine triphosphatase [Vibrio]EKO3606663.1 inosine/xanthosine triphosphatase [Vibrio metschnikovii]EKO3641120.1 inosine/xanthosine triphosphatase [Vibrio metschnikovii]EKO3655211.1 inosine/xanthosine triphosphatase [Vibrio metschnikovii]EKO3666015.1 inosine/xanthosine triphosphatase [Vibrio metschnikovii]EKO3707659.1 inosine/xanthosine triphosphatase [Vibrio metschnikovii]
MSSNQAIIHIIVASLNPAKINAVKSAFEQLFPNHTLQLQGVTVDSGVAAQPMSDEETKQGALNRVHHAEQAYPGADFYVGLEAGIEQGMTFAWMIVKSAEQYGESRSASLMLPPAINQRLHANNELGEIMDDVFGTDNIKQKGGAISLLTQHHLTRSSVYHQALILALVPFLHPELFMPLDLDKAPKK